MVWLQLLGSAVAVVIAAVQLAKYGDALAVRTGLGGMFIGTLLLAGATSLPELLTTINSLNQNVPDLAAGNMFGSSMFNMFLLAVLDLIHWRVRVLRRVAAKHALTASLATVLTGMIVFFMLADIDMRLGWVGADSVLVMVAYVAGVWLIQGNNLVSTPAPAIDIDEEMVPSLLRAGVGFGVATGVLVVVTPILVSSSVDIAQVLGISTGFFGAALLAIITSLPELVAITAAARIGAYDLAVGNLFGSNVFSQINKS